MGNATLNMETAVRPILTKSIERHQRAFDRAAESREPINEELDYQTSSFAHSPTEAAGRAVAEMTNRAVSADRTVEKSRTMIAHYSSQIDAPRPEADAAYVERVRKLTESRRSGRINGRELGVALRALRLEWSANGTR